MRFLLLAAFCSCFTIAFGQKNFKSDNKQAQKYYEEAGKNLSYGLTEKALEFLRSAINEDPKFAAAYQQTGDINRKMKRFEDAKLNYRKVLELDPEFDPYTFYGISESELNTGDYESALQHLRKYISYPSVSAENKKKAAKYIVDCEFSLDAIKKPVPYNPFNLGATINTDKEEYLPVVTADESTIIFTKRSNDNEDFYSSKRMADKWQSALPLSRNINTAEYNEGAQCISPDGMYLFFTGCNRPDGAGRCDIYVCKKEGKDWSKPFNLGPPINSSGWESQPSISANGRTLYFVSSRPGGLGGYDIWKTDLQNNGEWSDAVNLGPNINTPYDEISPFIHHDDNTLYFSSNGWPGLGDKDLYLSRKDDTGNWSKPQNLGYPINSHLEESCLTVSSSGKTAYFNSTRQGGFGGMDIYSFELPQPIRPQTVTYVKGRIFDSKTKEPLDANIKIVAVKTNKLAYEDVSDFDTGEFLATMPAAGKSFALSAEKKGYMLYSENFSFEKPESANKPYIISIPLRKIEAGSQVVLKNIFFDTNKYELLPESKVEIQQLISFLNTNPSVSIEIGGHTDNVGDDKLNQTLSENRAKAVYAFLLNNRIAPGRLSFKGYGKSAPVAANNTEEGRQQNRRTEFKITKE